MRGSDWLILAGIVLFFAAAAITLTGLYTGAAGGWIGPSLVCFVGAALCFGVGAWRSARTVDWKRVEAEQRLWESGPLGRAWLKIRKSLTGL